MNSRTRIITVCREVVLWCAGLAGVASVIFALVGTVGGFGIVLFRTGSMTPTIEAGAAALIRSTPASELAVGDIVTVPRDGREPITHRIVKIGPEEPGGPGAMRALTLQGDANADPDPTPYQVEQAGKVLISVPGAARAISALNNPTVLGITTGAVVALIVWAMWPSKSRAGSASDAKPGHSRDDGAGASARRRTVLM